MTTGDPIQARTESGVLWLTLSSPANRNALTAAMKVSLQRHAQALRDDPALRCLVITGRDGVFCAGGDLRTMADERSPEAVRRRMAGTHAVLRTLTAVEKPVLMAVNGLAVGAGLSLALCGDLVVCREDAQFAGGFSKVGVMPDLGVLLHLPRAVGVPRAKDLLMTARRVGAAEALAMGLVSRVLPTDGFDAAVAELARELAEGPAVSLGLTKALMDGAAGDTLDAFLLKESLGQAAAFGSDDFAEGVDAFLHKRKPVFRGR